MREELLKARHELDKTKKEFEEFAYIVSHDLNAPLRAITNLSEWIQEDLNEADESVKSNLKLLQNRVGRMKNMMDALIEYSRANRLYLDLEQTDVKEMIDDILLQFKLNTQKVIVKGQAPAIITYKKKLKTVLNNIISNAFFFHDKADGTIMIDYSENGEYLIFKIKDDGPGISRPEQEKIFKLFHTLNAKDEVDTTGAGLTIALKIVEFAGGSITLDTISKKGSCFILKWPKTINQI